MNTLFRHIAAVFTLSSLAVFSSGVSAQNFYKWVDSKGTTHYTQTPPPQGAKTTGQVRTFTGPTATKIQERTETSSAPPSQAAPASQAAPTTAPTQKPNNNDSTPQNNKKNLEVERN